MQLHLIATAGLMLIILGWALAWLRARRGRPARIGREFAGLHAIGVILLIIDMIQNGVYELGLLLGALLIVMMAMFFADPPRRG